MAVIELADVTVKVVASADPKRTAVAPLRLLPVIVTEAPPVSMPMDGWMLVTAGASPSAACASCGSIPATVEATANNASRVPPSAVRLLGSHAADSDEL
jgi:hypothetical protein